MVGEDIAKKYKSAIKNPLTGAAAAKPLPGQSVPWERRREIGLFKAFGQSFYEILFQPTRFFSLLSYRKSFLDAMVFFILVMGVLTIIGWAAQFGESPLNFMVPIFLIFGFVLKLGGAFMVAGFMHLFVRLFKGVGGYDGTFCVMMYSVCVIKILSISTNSLAGFPWLLMAASFGIAVLYIRIMVIGYKQVHSLSLPKAFSAFMIPFLILVCLSEVFGQYSNKYRAKNHSTIVN